MDGNLTQTLKTYFPLIGEGWGSAPSVVGKALGLGYGVGGLSQGRALQGQD